MMGRRVLPLTLLMLTACSSASGMSVRGAVVAEPAGPATAAYFEIENTSETGDRLIGVSADVAKAEIHRSFSESGTMHMEAMAFVDVGGGEVVVFRPGGLHVMLLDVADLQAGDTVNIILEFEEAGLVEIEAPVRPYSELLP